MGSQHREPDSGITLAFEILPSSFPVGEIPRDLAFKLLHSDAIHSSHQRIQAAEAHIQLTLIKVCAFATANSWEIRCFISSLRACMSEGLEVGFAAPLKNDILCGCGGGGGRTAEKEEEDGAMLAR